MALQWLAVVLAAGLAASGVQAGLDGHIASAEWHASSAPYKNLFDPSLHMAPHYDPAWANTKKGSASGIVVGPEVEFGWGKGPGHMITVDLHDDSHVMLTAHCDASQPECDFEDVHLTIRSTSFMGASLAMEGSTLTGRLESASILNHEGVVELKIADFKIVTNGQTQTQTCKLEIIQPNKCQAGECCDVTSGQPRPAGFVCRPVVHPCDIVEMCDGYSTACPEDQMTTDAEHCQQTAQGNENLLRGDERAAAPSADRQPPADVGSHTPLPHHDHVHGDHSRSCVQCAPGTRGAHCCRSNLHLNYIGLAALAFVIVAVVLRDRMGAHAKVTSPRGLPAYQRTGRPRW